MSLHEMNVGSGVWIDGSINRFFESPDSMQSSTTVPVNPTIPGYERYDVSLGGVISSPTFYGDENSSGCSFDILGVPNPHYKRTIGAEFEFLTPDAEKIVKHIAGDEIVSKGNVLIKGSKNSSTQKEGGNVSADGHRRVEITTIPHTNEEFDYTQHESNERVINSLGAVLDASMNTETALMTGCCDPNTGCTASIDLRMDFFDDADLDNVVNSMLGIAPILSSFSEIGEDAKKRAKTFAGGYEYGCATGENRKYYVRVDGKTGMTGNKTAELRIVPMSKSIPVALGIEDMMYHYMKLVDTNPFEQYRNTVLTKKNNAEPYAKTNMLSVLEDGLFSEVYEVIFGESNKKIAENKGHEIIDSYEFMGVGAYTVKMPIVDAMEYNLEKLRENSDLPDSVYNTMLNRIEEYRIQKNLETEAQNGDVVAQQILGNMALMEEKDRYLVPEMDKDASQMLYA